MLPVVVRPGSIEDAEGIGRVRILSWQAAYRGIMPQAHLDAMDLADQVGRTERRWPQDSSPAHWVAVSREEIVGWTYVSLLGRDPDLGGSVAEVQACYTLPRLWGQGVGHQMMESVIAHLREHTVGSVVLWLLQDNQRARAFYERQGFQPDGSTRQETSIPGVSLASVRLRRSI